MNTTMTKQNSKGFTIIEVVLVLAIAGLIFLMVFVAVPAMNRNSRDTARKNDVSLVSTAVTNYTGANRGAWPSSQRLREFVDDLSGNSDLDGVSMIEERRDSVEGLEYGEIVVVAGVKCGESTKTSQALVSATSREFAVITLLESGRGQYYCAMGG